MDSPERLRQAERTLTGWIAVIGAALGGVCLLAYLAVTGPELKLMFDPTFALTLAADDVRLFRLSMIADCFGFYLPVLALGVYFWRQRRVDGALAMDIGIFFLVVSTLLGVAGAMVPVAVLGPLVEIHASGDATAKQAAGITWVAVITGSQYGLWVMEGPTLGFWALVTGRELRRKGEKLGAPLMLLGIGYMTYAALMFLGAERIAQFGLLVVLPLQVLLIALFGMGLLKTSASAQRASPS